MSITTLNVAPLDPNLKTGPSRIMSGPVRMRAVVTDEQYGEFATWLYLGTTGDISIVQWDGTTIILHNLASGVWHPIYSIMINTTGTTAANIRWGS